MAEKIMTWSTEKLTERLQLRVGEGMKREIAALAELEERDLEDEARHIMRLGLEIKRAEMGKGILGAICQLLSHAPIQAPKAAIVSPRQMASAKKAGGGAA